MDYNCRIDHVVDTLKRGKKNKKKCSLLIGAGCSVTADVPTAEGFVNEIQKQYNACYRRAASKTYPKCMAELAPGQRKTLIKEFVDKAKINWTHICIAQLMKEGYIERVLTTNFDLLVVRACALLGEFPSVYDFASSQLLKPAEITDNAVFYLHGQYTGFVLMNTEDEVKKHSDLLEPVFEDAGKGRTWIVVGYSGENDPVFDHLSKVECFDDNLYLVGYGKNPPSKHVREQLLQENKYAYFIENYDSDRFFIALAQELNCFPPKLFSKPFTHLQDVFKAFTPFPVLDSDLGNKDSFDFTGKTKRMISFAVKTLEKGEASKTKTITQLQKNVIKAEEYYMKGDYRKVITLEKLIKKDRKAKDMVYWSYISLGNEIFEKADLVKGKEKEKHYLKAIEYYAKGKSTKESPNEALINWGNALSNLAEIKEKPDEKEKLNKEAFKKYEEALKIKPDDHEALYNWGTALSNLAKIKEKPDEKEKLYKEAFKKYEEVLKIKPDDHEALNNWGIVLSNLAEIKEKPDEKEKLNKEALEILHKAEQISEGSASYDLACIYSLLNNPVKCRVFLKKSKKYGTLPSRGHLKQDPDLDNVRSKKWYREFVKKL